MDQTEVTNVAWQEMLFSLRQQYGENAAEFLAMIPDSVQWKKTNQQTFSFKKLSDESLSNLPIVGITRKQAIEYCAWRSNRVNEKYGKNCVYSLPTKEDILHVQKTIPTTNPNPNKKTLVPVNESNKSKGFYGLYSNAAEWILEKDLVLVGDQVVSNPGNSGPVSFRCVARVE